MKRIILNTQASPRSMPYVSYMLTAATRLAHRPELVTVVVDHVDDNTGSAGHAAAANAALKRVSQDPGAIHIIADSDTVLLHPRWDDVVRDRLDRSDIAGVRFADKGGFSTGTSASQYYKGLPTMTWLALRGDATDWSQLDVMPVSDRDKKSIASLSLSPAATSACGLDAGDLLLQDVGWRIPLFLHERGLKAEAFPRMTGEGRTALAGLSEYHEEWHVDGRPFVVHQRGSRKHAFREGDHSRPFYDRCERWLNEAFLREPVDPSAPGPRSG